MKKAFLNKCYALGLLGVVFTVAFTSNAWALNNQDPVEVDGILKNIVASSTELPALISGAAYLLGLLLGITAIIKLKDHVTNPSNTPLRTPLIRLIIGGCLFSLPMVYEAVAVAINGGTQVTNFDPAGTWGSKVSELFGTPGSWLKIDFNGVLASIEDSISDVPGFITAGTYLLGLLLGVSGLLKLKDHVENPDQVQLRESIVRLLVAGALFAIPSVYEAIYNSIGGAEGGGLFANIASILGTLNLLSSSYDRLTICSPVSIATSGLGDVFCAVVANSSAFPAFLTAIGYLIGLGLGVWGILKIKAHVLNPQQTGLHEGIMRLLAAGMFFALPAMVEVARATVSSTPLMGIAQRPTTGYNDASGAATACEGLDGVVYCMMNDTFGPMHIALNFFAMCAGFILIMIGISRLLKSAQDGARGPAGFGTVMTFIAGGALVSYNEMMRAATSTLFSNPMTSTHATLVYSQGMSQDELAHSHAVIGAIIKFMILVGLISFVRGIFIIRDVAEGSSQASLMAGITHIIGGALAVNLGPLINAVQTTLGITGYGITFS